MSAVICQAGLFLASKKKVRSFEKVVNFLKKVLIIFEKVVKKILARKKKSGYRPLFVARKTPAQWAPRKNSSKIF